MSISLNPADWIAYLKQYPESFAILIAMVLSWGIALWAERVVFNPGLSTSARQRASSAVTTAACLVLTMVLWPVFDPSEKSVVRIVVSIGVACCSPFIFVLVTKFLGQRFPWLASAFTAIEPPDPPAKGDSK